MATIVYGNGTAAQLPSSLLSEIFGNGADGAVDLDGTNTYAWASKSGAAYTLLRDVYATTLIVQNGSLLKTNGFRVFASTSLNVVSGGAVENDAEGTYTGAVRGYLGGGANGGFGGGGGNSLSFSAGGNGGAGGAGSSLPGSSGGTAQYSKAQFAALEGYVGALLAITTHMAGGAGGGGGGIDGINPATSGGGGGGVVIIAAPTITGSGTIRANGQVGQSASGGTNNGGAGGGGGGCVVLVTSTAVSGPTIQANAGSGGSGAGTGINGSAGSSGSTRNIVLS